MPLVLFSVTTRFYEQTLRISHKVGKMADTNRRTIQSINDNVGEAIVVKGMTWMLSQEKQVTCFRRAESGHWNKENLLSSIVSDESSAFSRAVDASEVIFHSPFAYAGFEMDSLHRLDCAIVSGLTAFPFEIKLGDISYTPHGFSKRFLRSKEVAFVDPEATEKTIKGSVPSICDFPFT